MTPTIEEKEKMIEFFNQDKYYKLWLAIQSHGYFDYLQAAMTEYAKQTATEFLDEIREYERESGNKICFDERTSEELYNKYKNND